MSIPITFPFTFVNGTTIDGPQFNSNFAAVATAFGLAAPANNPIFTGTITTPLGAGPVVSNAGGVLSVAAVVRANVQVLNLASTWVDSGSGPIMGGLGAAGCVVTPTNTGVLFLQWAGQFGPGSSTGWNFQGRYGTGTPPAHNAADTGTAFGQSRALGNPANASNWQHSAIVTGLTLGLVYWFDIYGSGPAGGDTARITSSYFLAWEL